MPTPGSPSPPNTTSIGDARRDDSMPPRPLTLRRRWRVLAPPRRSFQESIPGQIVLEEMSGELALLVWRLLRLAEAWTDTHPSERPGLVEPEAPARYHADIVTLGAPPELEEILVALARVATHPGEVEPLVVALSLCRASAWAQGEGHLRSARRLAEAATRAAPTDPSAALQVARTARLGDELEDAELWYQHTVCLARHAGDWPSYVNSWIGLTKVAMRQGRLPAASRAAQKTLRAAQRRALPLFRAYALHELFAVCVERGMFEQAEQYAAQAAQAYPAGDSSIPILAHDVAYLWLLRGEFGRALPVLEVVAPLLESLPDGARAWSSVARAAGAVGDESIYRRAEQAWTRAGDAAPTDAWLDFARAAASLGRVEDALAYAAEAGRRALSKGEHKLVFEAEALRESARSEAGRFERPVSVPAPMDDHVVQALVGAMTAD